MPVKNRLLNGAGRPPPMTDAAEGALIVRTLASLGALAGIGV
jgi:hypothetical protein